jgi:flagellum-specific peptidoglycan hydrolase FlgJ
MKTTILILLLSFTAAAQRTKPVATTNLGACLLKIENDKVSCFINRIYKDAVFVKEKYGIPVALTIGQACFESGYGKSKLAKESNNFFGIRRNHKFCKYKSQRECFEDYAGSVLSARCYNVRPKDTLQQWYKALQECKYFAPNKGYIEKLNNIIFRYNLDLLN